MPLGYFVALLSFFLRRSYAVFCYLFLYQWVNFIFRHVWSKVVTWL